MADLASYYYGKFSMNRNYLFRLIRDYKDACVRMSWMGSQHPDEHDDIEQWHRESKRKLYNYIKKHTEVY